MNYIERMELKERLRKEKNVGFITLFKDCGKEYIKAIKVEDDSKFKYVYFEFNNGEYYEVQDDKTLKRLREIQEIEDERVY